MRKHTSSLEGFIPRQSGSKLGDFHSADKQQAAKKAPSRQIKTDGETVLSKDTVGQPRKGRLIGRDDIDESLREIDDASFQETKKSRKERKKYLKAKKPKRRVRRIIFWVLLVWR